MNIDNKIINLLRLMPAGIYYGGIWFLSSAPVLINISGFDKTLHILEYSILGFLLAFGFSVTKKNFESNTKYCMYFGVLAGIIDEIHQYFVPGRSMDIIDLFADITGIAAGILVWLIASLIFKKQK